MTVRASGKAGEGQDETGIVGAAISINGLTYIRNFVDRTTHDDLLRQVDASPWSDALKRRVQHYGYRYDYKARQIDASMAVTPFPPWARLIADLLCVQGLAPHMPDQLIVNEYLPGQGISGHVDCVPCFTDTIISVSLGSACVMEFTHIKTRQVASVLLEQGSAVVLRAEARYGWKHGIRARKIDRIEGSTIERARRVSLTFRKVILNQN